jgi:hypothetical protein
MKFSKKVITYVMALSIFLTPVVATADDLAPQDFDASPITPDLSISPVYFIGNSWRIGTGSGGDISLTFSNRERPTGGRFYWIAGGGVMDLQGIQLNNNPDTPGLTGPLEASANSFIPYFKAGEGMYIHGGWSGGLVTDIGMTNGLNWSGPQLFASENFFIQSPDIRTAIVNFSAFASVGEAFMGNYVKNPSYCGPSCVSKEAHAVFGMPIEAGLSFKL